MKSKLLKTLVFILILILLILYGSLLFYKIDFLTLSINDLGRHIQNGRMLLETRDVLKTNFYSYAEPDFPFVNHHWLSGLIFYLLHEAVGFGGMVIFKIAVLLASFVLLFLASMKKANFWLVALLSLPAILMLKERSELRPEIFSYLFTAIFLYFLIDSGESPERKRIFWLIPLQLLWANLHAFFPIGVLLTGGFLLEKIILNRKNLKNSPLVKKSALLLLFLVAVSFINPNGIKGVFYLSDIFQNYGFEVSENKSLFWAVNNYWWDASIKIFMPMVFLLAVSFLFSVKHKPVFYFLGACGTAIASFFAIRTLPLFALIFLPAASLNLNGVFLKIKEIIRGKWLQMPAILKKISVLAGVGIFIFAAFFIYKAAIPADTTQELGIGLVSDANAAAVFFKEQNLKGPIFNDYNIGSYLIYHLFPEEKVFVDNRPEAYPASFFQNVYYPMLEQEEKWQEVQKKYNFNAVFLSSQNLGGKEEIFLMARLADPEWRLIYADAYSVILLKNTPGNKNIIEKFQITPENVSEKTNHLQESDKLEQRVAALNLFSLLGREDLIPPVLQKITEKWPEYSQGWLMMGMIYSAENDLSSLNSAVTFMERAIDLGEKTSDAYTLLGLTYFRSGQFEKAEKALKRALKIDANRQDARNYLIQLQKYLKN